MQVEDTGAPQGVPGEGEAAHIPADHAPESGSEQTPQPDGSGQQTPAEPKPEGPEGDKPKQAPWFQRRIDDLTREKWEARREAEALKAALDAVKGVEAKPDGTPDPARTVPQDDVERRAQQIADERSFNDHCNRTYQQGTKEFSDFDEALGNFRMLGGLPRDLIEAATEAGEPHKILYALGKDPEKAAQILALPPVRMAAAVAKLASSPAPAPKPVSSAPAPIAPVGGVSAKSDPDPEKMSMSEWMAWRNQQLAKARG